MEARDCRPVADGNCGIVTHWVTPLSRAKCQRDLNRVYLIIFTRDSTLCVARIQAIVILSVCLSRPGTNSSPGEIEIPGFHCVMSWFTETSAHNYVLNVPWRVMGYDRSSIHWRASYWHLVRVTQITALLQYLNNSAIPRVTKVKIKYLGGVSFFGNTCTTDRLVCSFVANNYSHDVFRMTPIKIKHIIWDSFAHIVLL